MRVLLDNSTPRGVASALIGHDVSEARDYGWDTLENGALLREAEKAGFEVLLTPEQNLYYQQNLTGRKVAIVVITKGRWTLVKHHHDRIAEAVSASTPGSYTTVEIPYRDQWGFRRAIL